MTRELSLFQTGRLVTGPELEAMSDAELAQVVDEVEVYACVSPAHKLRVVSALQAKGHVAAMTGDGVNDAPALKKADIGIAMGVTGTDVSKEAAAMTLTDDNFASIVAAVEEGRGIFSNIKKYLLSSNIGEIGLMAGAALLGLPLPLSAVQLLDVNLATDGLPAMALAVDPPEADLMRRPPRSRRDGIFTRPVVTLMTVGGLWSTCAHRQDRQNIIGGKPRLINCNRMWVLGGVGRCVNQRINVVCPLFSYSRSPILKSMPLVAWVQARLVSSHFGFARVLYRQNGRLDWIPIPVRLATRTRGHDLVVMLAYRSIQTLAQYWHALDVTVAEGLQELEALGVTDIVLANGGSG